MDDATKSILTNADSTSAQLADLMNQNGEINKLIGRHPNADSETLAEIIGFWDDDADDIDLELRRTVVKHPNASIETLVELGREFPSLLLENPSLKLLLRKHPDFLELIPEVLMIPECPVEIMRSAIASGDLMQKAMLALNPALPNDFRGQLLPRELAAQSDTALEKFTDSQKDKWVKECLSKYRSTSRPFCIPRFLELDQSNPEHRKQDQVLSGFPYTSKKWQWPVGPNGRHMQPIAQVDLEIASINLGESLGSGLLQVWGGIDKSELNLRLIPNSDLEEPVDNFYPEDPPWLATDLFGDAEMYGCMISPFPLSAYRPFAFSNCRVEWVPFGNMFYPSLTTRILYALESENDSLEFDGKLERRLERVDEHLNKIEIPTGKKPCMELLFRLGGYTDGLGNTWDRYPDSLLLYHSIDRGVKITVGVTYRKSSDGHIEFFADSTCDK